MSFEKELEWGDVILAALATANEQPDDDVTIFVPDKPTALVVKATIRALKESGDEAAWRLQVEIKGTH